MDILILLALSYIFKLNRRKLFFHYLLLMILLGWAISLNFDFTPGAGGNTPFGNMVQKDNPGTFAGALLDVGMAAYVIFIGLIIMGTYSTKPKPEDEAQ